ncbi:MAG: hypothetical protein K2Y39_09150 [Candidatus Obscuribacterales bacterium]|nr:hypothetical protein [Candidatus Obscuribacterales bacterium]
MKIEDLVKKQWTVRHDDSEIRFETLDAAIWYAAGAASVSNSIRQINSRDRLITLVPTNNLMGGQPFDHSTQKCAA